MRLRPLAENYLILNMAEFGLLRICACITPFQSGWSQKMATCLCLLDEEERIAARHSKRIDEKLDRERDQYKREIKILLLGAGESGKSTFLKQMRIIHGENYSPEERAEFRPIIYHNVLKGMKILIDSQRKLGIMLGEPSNEDFCDIIASHRSVHLDPAQFSQYVDPLQALWRDEGVQAVYGRRNEFQLVSTGLHVLVRNVDWLSVSRY